jgi:hypothetical protein
LGSIQLFPRRGAVTIADVWRVAPVASGGAIRVRPARVEDYAAIRALERQSRLGARASTLRGFEARRHVFPEGQWVAECEGAIAGAGGSLLVTWDGDPLEPSWRALVGDGGPFVHDPLGRTLFAFDVVADFTRRGFGVARALHLARRRLCRRLNLRRIAAALPLSGCGAPGEPMAPEHYVRRVLWGEAEEPMLRFHLAQGFQFCGILRGFHGGDREAGGHAALVAWLNPLYAPPGPGAGVASQRARKCA